jgi:hypothetical protein
MSAMSEPQEQVFEQRGRPQRRIVAGVVAVFGCLAVLVLFGAVLLLQALHGTAKARMQSAACAARLKQIGIALQNYHDEHNAWPPAVVTDSKGNPLHSWRVLILPHLGIEEEKLYKRYQFDEPWNGPRNVELAESMPKVYGCPLDPAADQSQTSFLAVIDPATGDFAVHPAPAGTSTGPAPPKPMTPFMVVEVAESNVNWMEPKDLVLSGKQAPWPAAKLPAELSYHVGRSHALLDDLSDDEVAEGQVRAELEGKGNRL